MCDLCQNAVMNFVDMTSVFQYLEFCDDILVLEDGEVLEAGNHQALVKANGRYAQLIINYQLEQSKVRLQYKTQMCSHHDCLYCFTSKTFSLVLRGFPSSQLVKGFLIILFMISEL